MSRRRVPLTPREAPAVRQEGNFALPRHFSGLSKRQRFTVFSSAAYILLGTVIIVRSIVAMVIPVAVLGAVFIALGVVKLRDFWKWSRTHDAS